MSVGTSFLLPALNSFSTRRSAIKSTIMFVYTFTIPSPFLLSLCLLRKRLWSYFWTNTSRKSVKDYHDTGGNTELDLRSYLVKKKFRTTCHVAKMILWRQRESADTPTHWIKQRKAIKLITLQVFMVKRHTHQHYLKKNSTMVAMF